MKSAGDTMNEKSLRQEEEQLREQITQLNSEQKKSYYALEVAQVKDPDTYAALNWAFLAGLHHFYLGKWQRGLLNLVLMLVGVLFYLSQLPPLLGAGVILLVFIIELPQLFNSQQIIHQYNNDVMKRLLKQVSS
jgi:hypothetical protein